MATACALSGCSPEPERHEGTSRQRIIGGAFDPGDPAVVGIVLGGHLGCTGTLVAPTVVLTAAHCFEHDAVDGVYFGSEPGRDGTRAEVLATEAHPEFDHATARHDIAVVILREPSPVPPVPLRWTAPEVGTQGRAVGFGATRTDAPASKHTGEVVVTRVTPSAIRVEPSPAMPCAGDSGGPVLAGAQGNEALFGVISNGDATCSAFVMLEPLSANRTFLAPYLAEAPAPADGEPLLLGGGGCAAGPARSSAGESFAAALAALVAGRRRRTAPATPHPGASGARAGPRAPAGPSRRRAS